MAAKPHKAIWLPHLTAQVGSAHAGTANSCEGCSAASGNRGFCHAKFPPQHTALGLHRALHNMHLGLACGCIAMGALVCTGCPVWGHHGLHHNPGMKSCLAGRAQLHLSAGGSTALSRVVPYREHCSNSMWEWRKPAEDLMSFTLLPEWAPLPSVQSVTSSNIA